MLLLLYDILLRFRLGAIAITANIKQAFLKKIDNIFDVDPSILVYRFTRVIFGLNSSPFLLNGTLKVHFSKLLYQ